jgi:hypothetical protein
MTKNASQREVSQKEVSSGSLGPLAAVTLANGPMFDAFTRAGEACTKACLAWQQELVRFTGARLTKDSQLGQSMTECQNLTDLAKAQQDWAAAAAQDYLNEATRLTELAAKLTQEGVAPWHAGGQSSPPGATHSATPR